jgi:hypothetical protein
MIDYERYLINLALTVLREVAEAPAVEQKPSSGTRLALRVLRPHCPDQWPLTQFWSGINASDDVVRVTIVTASLNSIIHQLAKSGSLDV